MDGLTGFVLFVAAFVALDVLALRFGRDSREKLQTAPAGWFGAGR